MGLLTLTRKRGGGGAPSYTYATWNPADNGGLVLTLGDLRVTGIGGWLMARCTIPKNADEWSAEHTVVNSGGACIFGISTAAANLYYFLGSDPFGFGYFSYNGNMMHNGSGVAFGDTWNGAGDKVGLKFNATARTATFYRNGVPQGSPVDLSSLAGPLIVSVANFSPADVTDTNFGATAMAYSYGAANTGVFTP